LAFSPDSCASIEAAWVAGKFELSRRRDNVSFEHHATVAGQFELSRRRDNVSFEHHATVAGIFEFSLRSENLTWAHHSVVAGLNLPVALRLLKQAEQAEKIDGKRWPIAKLRGEVIKLQRAMNDTGQSPMPRAPARTSGTGVAAGGRADRVQCIN